MSIDLDQLIAEGVLDGLLTESDLVNLLPMPLTADHLDGGICAQ